MTMNIGITLKNAAYTPEAYAYKNYLEKFGHHIQLDFEENLDPNNDVNIFFMGTRPFWKKEKCRAIEIHEYQSLSVPQYSKLKDYLKVMINSIPDGRIFLNDIVHRQLNFKDKIPYIYRDMGVDKDFFQKKSDNPKFDIIYSGSIYGRTGLSNVLLRLARRYSIIVVGIIPEELILPFRKAGITIVGRVERKYLPELYKDARYGLNYTPDIYPYNIQTSTKTLEYLASGLGIISNKYAWSSRFFSDLGISPIWLDSVEDLELKSENLFIDMTEYCWDNILKNSNLNNFLHKLV